MNKYNVVFHLFCEDNAQTETIYSFFIKANNGHLAERKMFSLLSEKHLIPDDRIIDEINIRFIKRVAGEYHTKRK